MYDINKTFEEVQLEYDNLSDEEKSVYANTMIKTAWVLRSNSNQSEVLMRINKFSKENNLLNKNLWDVWFIINSNKNRLQFVEENVEDVVIPEFATNINDRDTPSKSNDNIARISFFNEEIRVLLEQRRFEEARLLGVFGVYLQNITVSEIERLGGIDYSEVINELENQTGLNGGDEE